MFYRNPISARKNSVALTFCGNVGRSRAIEQVIPVGWHSGSVTPPRTSVCAVVAEISAKLFSCMSKSAWHGRPYGVALSSVGRRKIILYFFCNKPSGEKRPAILTGLAREWLKFCSAELAAFARPRRAPRKARKRPNAALFNTTPGPLRAGSSEASRTRYLLPPWNPNRGRPCPL